MSIEEKEVLPVEEIKKTESSIDEKAIEAVADSESHTIDSSETETKSVEIKGVKHIKSIKETEDSLLIEFSKGEIKADQEGDCFYKRSFIKSCSIEDSEEDKGVKRFKATLPIEASQTEPIYEDDIVVDYKNVTFKGYGSTNEAVTKGDRIGDFLRKGAFKKTIKEFKKNPVMLIDHENSVRNIAGSYTKIKEDANGLYLEGRISNAPELATIRALVAEGHLQTLSIGGMFYYEDDGKAIHEVDLFEVSLVAIPMNPDARFEAV